MEPLRVGIIGVGNISGIYLRNLAAFPETTIVAVADLDLERAKAVAEKHGIAKALSPEQLLADSDVELVLNLTIPKAHVPVARQAIAAGKHVYSEKPLGLDLDDANSLISEAKAKGLLVGCAPDTFMGSGIQTCRKLIDDGAIGVPIAANAFMLCRGHETWHPSPEFYYEQGGGPMLDMGPYYITALVNLIGGIKRVSASTRITFPTRTISSQPKAGKVLTVETSTHMAGTLDFEGGAIGQLTTSFDVFGNPMPNIVVYGTEGTLIVPDPNGFGGEPKLKRAGSDWESVELTHNFDGNARGVGVLDMAYAIRTGAAHRASGDLALHVLDVMLAYDRSSESGTHVKPGGLSSRPEAMPVNAYPEAWAAIKDLG